ncbi:ribonuclease H-like domain-containing protein [Mycena vulgaris]|nr:ribonuclease H-like domain-containing protein [Mycena vulgaris]
MTGRSKTGDELFKLVKSDLAFAKETYGVDVIAVCTDDGPDGKKMRRLIKEQTPSIVAFERWVHQSSLITGNYLSVKAPWMATAKLVIEVIKILALILPVIPRWVSQYCSLRHLKKLERGICACVITHEARLRACVSRKDEQIEAADRIIAIVKDDGFWKNIERIASDLEPLAIASNLLQAPTCRLDTILLCLRNIHRIFSRNNDTIVKSTVIKSLERRWAKTDQELMILAVFLNPYIRWHASNRRWLQNDVRNISCGGFVKLAIRILSIVPNSAGPERIFSTYGLTHTKHRNRLNRPKVYKSTLVRMVRKESHRAAGVLPQRRPRHFSLADDQVKIAAMDADSASPAQVGGGSVGPSATDENEMDFGVVADLLINLAAGEDAENEAAAAAPSIATIPPRTSAFASTIDPVLRLPPYKKIKLADLFEYPAPGTPADELEFFWKGGVNGLDEEESSHQEEVEGSRSENEVSK